jgi:uncharacterized protein YndB with AHSA1/START domain
MAFARLLLRTLLVLLILLVAIGLLLPDSARVERSILIAAPPARVFPQVNDLHAFHAWSPWAALDSDTRYSFEGPEQGVGARMTWHSEQSNVGSGNMRIVRSDPPREVETHLDFGGKGGGTATFLLTPEDSDKTLVTWRFDTRFGWDLFGRYVGLMLDKIVGASYEKGLQTLKQRVEGS